MKLDDEQSNLCKIYFVDPSSGIPVSSSEPKEKGLYWGY
jgi:hypothetical protein